MSDDIYIDVNYLTESERDAILQVLAKDEELRKQEKRRIGKLKNELDEIKKNGASEDEISSSRICARCRSPLGLIFNSGALCPKCEARVCKECRKENIDYNLTSSWLCILCAKIREVRAESGAWFFEQERRKGDRPQLYGSALVRASFRRAKPTSQHNKVLGDTEPGSPPVITLNLDNHGGKLHRPVPVHMSRLVEKEAEEEEEKRNEEEINQNYVKQYAKANRVPQKDMEEEEKSDEQDKGSSTSPDSTPRGSPVHDLGNDDVEVPEETVFDHLVNQHNTTIETTGKMDEEIHRDDEKQWDNQPHGYDAINGYGKDEAQDYEEKVNNWEIEREEIEHNSEEEKHETSVEIKTKWHEVADEWADTGNGYEQPAQESQPQMAFLGARSASPDSETTGDFFTPLATPLHSGTGTPALSEHGQSEEGLTSGSEMYEDAGEATPIEGDRTPVAELSEEDGEENIVDVTVSSPEIALTTFPEDSAESEKINKVSTQDNDIDDIDQAFANYGGSHQDMGKQTTLQEQLNIISMGSRESIVSYYSDAGEGRFGNVPVTGEVLFGLRYDKHKYQLEVQIHRAKDIAPADEKRGRSDPYVKVYLLPDKTKGGKRKTKTKKNTLEPDFDEILKFKIGFDEMLTRTLWLAMWNHDTFGHNDFLGEVMLPLDTYQESGFNWDDPSPNWYPLQDRRPEPSLLSYCGDLTFSLMFEPGEESQQDKKKKKKKSGGKLHVQLKEARNLPAKDANGFSDPFVKRNVPKFFDKNTSEKAQESHEKESLAELTHSHENLAFEEESKLMEPQNTSTDSTTSTMETTLESSTSDGNDSGIVDSQMNGSDVSPTTIDVRENNETEPGRDIKPAFKVLGSFAMELAMTSPPEIKVDKPKTLSSVAKGDSTDAPVSKMKGHTLPSGRRNTDHNINKDRHKKSTLSPDAALIKRRHSDFAVSSPKSINEELATEDLKRRGSSAASNTEKPRKGSIEDFIRKGRGPQWSPNMERKRQEEAKTGHKKDERRKTLAELAEAHGYKSNIQSNIQEPQVAVETHTLQVAQGDTTKGSRESLSENENEHYSSIPVTGELFVSLRYEMRSNKFELHIHNANNLASADPKKGTSDPYVKTYLLPDKRSKRKTKNKKETLNPNFDEILEYFIGYDELLTRTLHLSVWHKSLGGNEFLGEVKIPMNGFVEAHGNTIQQWVAKWLTLTDQRDVTDGLPSNPCELVLALKYVTSDKVKNKRGRSKGELHVHLLEARNLPGMDADGMSDPYCKCYLLPDKKGKSKQKTPIIKRTLNPTFDHKFSYEEVSLEELKERVLEITIYDFDRASSDEFLGGVRLGLGTSSNEWDDATEDETQIWQTMLSRSNVWIQVVVPLRSSMVSMKHV